MMRGMVINMNNKQLLTLAQLQAFLNETVAVDFSVTAEERYDFIARTVCRFGYRRLKRAEKAMVLRFLERLSVYSRQQLTRLVKRFHVVIAGVGTGGTIIGVGQAFKAVNPACKVVALDPSESCTILCGEIGKHLIAAR